MITATFDNEGVLVEESLFIPFDEIRLELWKTNQESLVKIEASSYELEMINNHLETIKLGRVRLPKFTKEWCNEEARMVLNKL